MVDAAGCTKSEYYRDPFVQRIAFTFNMHFGNVKGKDLVLMCFRKDKFLTEHSIILIISTVFSSEMVVHVMYETPPSSFCPV